jgi:hypothetical protein
MAYTPGVAFVRQYEDSVLHLASQRDARFSACITQKTVVGRSLEVERVAASDAVTKSSRHAATPAQEIVHTRRRAAMADEHWAEMVAKTDEVKMVIDPKSAYQVELAGAYNRSADDVIIAALVGNSVSVAEAGTEANVAITNNIAHGSTGMTVAKVRQARELILASDPDENDQLYFALQAKQQMELLDDPELTDTDYSLIKRAVDGEITGTYMGFKFIRSERLPLATADRTCIAFSQSSLAYGLALPLSVQMAPRADLSMSLQIYGEWTHGAVRTDEASVVTVHADET